ncbi:MAG: ATP-binding protein, partial [Candidatus Binataceae bacterium]
QTALMLAERAPFDPHRLGRILELLGDAYSITEFDHPRGIECIERAAKIYESVAMPIEAANLHARLGLMLSLRSPAMNIPRAMAEYRQAEAVLRTVPDSQSQILLYTGLAQAATQAQHTQEGLSAAHRAMEIATHLGEEALWIRAAAHHSDHLFHSGRMAEAAALMDDAWHRADRLDNLDGAFETAWSGGYHPLALWDPREAERWFARELARPRMAQALFQRRVLIQHMAFGYVFRGQLGRAKELLAESPRVLVEAFIMLYEGNWERAAVILEESRDALRAAGSRDGETVYAYFQGLVCLAAGDFAGAEAMNQVTLQAAIEGPHVPYALNAHAQAALISILRGRPDGAHIHLARCREIIAGGENFRGLFGRVALAEAMAAAAEDRRDAAERQFTSALEIFRRSDVPWDMAQTHHLWGAALLSAGALSRASEHFDAAQAIYQRHGAAAVWIEKVNAARGHARSRAGEPAQRKSEAAEGGISEPAEGAFRCEGDYWTVALGEAEIRLRNTKGLFYLAHLIARPDQSITAEELARIGSTAAGAHARMVSGAKGALEVSPGGARVMVTKSIKAAIRRIRTLDISVGHNLATSIRTGYSCVYEPDPIRPIKWTVKGLPSANAKPRN